jgi:hypothetical protein
MPDVRCFGFMTVKSRDKLVFFLLIIFKCKKLLIKNQLEGLRKGLRNDK